MQLGLGNAAGHHPLGLAFVVVLPLLVAIAHEAHRCQGVRVRLEQVYGWSRGEVKDVRMFGLE